ncbi:unnamed protein product [Ectocarpus sp. 8 AP-2014]
MEYIVHSGMPPNELRVKSNELEYASTASKVRKEQHIRHCYSRRMTAETNTSFTRPPLPSQTVKAPQACSPGPAFTPDAKSVGCFGREVHRFDADDTSVFPTSPVSLTVYGRLKREFAWYGGTSATLGACDENVTSTVSEAILSPETGSKRTISLRSAPLRCLALMESICFPALLPLVPLV